MKTTLMILSSILISASALADVRTETFDIHGPVAKKLESVLVAAGAKTAVLVDSSNMEVTNLDCQAGFMEMDGGHHFAKCTFQQKSSPVCRPHQICSHMMRIENLEVSGNKAKAINAALEEAGVKARHYTEWSRRFAVRVTCNNLIAGGGRLTSCMLEVPGGM